MRNEEQFNKIIKAAKWFTNFHNTPVWIVPTENDYQLSVIAPKSKDLPEGTAAIFIDQFENVLDTICHSDYLENLSTP